MQSRLSSILILTVAAALVAGPAVAAKKKHRAALPHRVSAEPASGIPYDKYGNPIIMQGFQVRGGEVTAEPAAPPREPRQVHIPSGSSTYIPPPVPSPYGSNSPPAPGALAPGPGVYQPPPINSFSDRVTKCIMSAPFNAGVGNNPAGRDAYVGQCAN